MFLLNQTNCPFINYPLCFESRGYALYISTKTLTVTPYTLVDASHDGLFSEQDQFSAKPAANCRCQTSCSVTASCLRALLFLSRIPSTFQEAGSLFTIPTRSCLPEVPYANSYLYDWYPLFVTTANPHQAWSSTDAIHCLRASSSLSSTLHHAAGKWGGLANGSIK